MTPGYIQCTVRRKTRMDACGSAKSQFHTNRDHCMLNHSLPLLLFSPHPITAASELIQITVEEIRSVDTQERCQEFNVDTFSSDASAASGNMLQMHIINSTGENVCSLSPCSPNPCQNGGACAESSDTAQGFTCSCTPGWEGDNCQTDIDECFGGERHLYLTPYAVLCIGVCTCTQVFITIYVLMHIHMYAY